MANLIEIVNNIVAKSSEKTGHFFVSGANFSKVSATSSLAFTELSTHAADFSPSCVFWQSVR